MRIVDSLSDCNNKYIVTFICSFSGSSPGRVSTHRGGFMTAIMLFDCVAFMVGLLRATLRVRQVNNSMVSRITDYLIDR